MGEFERGAREMLEAISGKENIAAITHCTTRMCFVLNNKSKADVKRLEAIPAVKGTFTNAGQFQAIIGNDVPIFYNDFTAVSGIGGVSREATKSAAQRNQNWLQRALAMLAEIFTPIIPAIIVGGLILGFRNILGGVKWSTLNDKTIVEVPQFWSNVNSFLWLPGEAIFHYLPVGIVWSMTRKMGTNQILGIVLGICLISSNQLLNTYNVASMSAAEIAANWTWNFDFFTVQRIGYQAQVIPVLLAGLSLACLERFWRKHIPEVISMIFMPFLSLISVLILAHTMLGPIGWTVGRDISAVVLAGLTGPVKWPFGAIFGALYASLVITGLCHVTDAIDTQLIADVGGTGFWPMIALSNITQGSTTLAFYVVNRHDEREAQASLPATILAYLGVMEPALFEVNLKYVYPFVTGIIGPGIAGLFCTSFNITANAIGIDGLPGIPSTQAKYMGLFAIDMVIAIIILFVLIFTFRRVGFLTEAEDEVKSDENSQVQAAVEAKKDVEVPAGTVISIQSPLVGHAKNLSEAPDPASAQGVMGQGAVIEPTEGELVVPADGVVSVLFPTKHAIGLVSDEGLELLMHIGMDTVNLGGGGFAAHVKQGDRISVGDALVSFDMAAIQTAGYPVTTPVIVTNQSDFQTDVIRELPCDVARGEAAFIASKL